MTYERFIDRKDKKELIRACPDFRIRAHGMPQSQMIYAFIGVLLCTLLLIIHLSIKLLILPDSEPTPMDEILGFMVAIGLLIIGTAIFAYVIVQRIRDIILETEFQNLLFAGAVTLDSDFCLISNDHKAVVYYNNEFAELFASVKGSNSNLEKLLGHKGIKEADKDKLREAVVNNKSVSVPFALTKSKKMTVTVDPLPRPAGFSVIRGSGK